MDPFAGWVQVGLRVLAVELELPKEMLSLLYQLHHGCRCIGNSSSNHTPPSLSTGKLNPFLHQPHPLPNRTAKSVSISHHRHPNIYHILSRDHIHRRSESRLQRRHESLLLRARLNPADISKVNPTSPRSTNQPQIRLPFWAWLCLFNRKSCC